MIQFSVIVPSHQGELLLPEVLGALRRSDDPGVPWELIVVDDGSTDATGELASQLADTVVRLAAPARGPAWARNAGAAAARGEWLLFVDGDVRVRPETLGRFWASVREHPGVSAIVGSYDASPAARGAVSKYRNLCHRYWHLRDAGQAETFWAGLGGIRADQFRSLGGFDAVRYPRPQIEDIELGYRLRAAGGVILIDPSIEATHLKRLNFAQMARTDFFDRALPWMRLLLERRGSATPSLNISRTEQGKVLLAGAALAAGPAVVVLGHPGWWWLAPALLGALALSSLPLVRWLARVAGLPLALAAVPLQLWHYLSNAVAASIGILMHTVRPEPSTARGSHA